MPNYSTPEVLFQIIKASKENDNWIEINGY